MYQQTKLIYTQNTSSNQFQFILENICNWTFQDQIIIQYKYITHSKCKYCFSVILADGKEFSWKVHFIPA